MRPRGTATVGPPGMVASGPGRGSTETSAAALVGAVDSTTVREATWPASRTTTSWGTRSAGTRPARWTPKALDALLRTEKNPGMVDRAISVMALNTPRPTFRSSASLRVRHHWATASSLDAGSILSVRTMRDSTDSKSSGPSGIAIQNASSASAALASTSRPVRATERSARWPPMAFIETFNVVGGGSPCTPWIRTRSGPTSSSWMVSNRDVTSGPR